MSRALYKYDGFHPSQLPGLRKAPQIVIAYDASGLNGGASFRSYSFLACNLAPLLKWLRGPKHKQIREKLGDREMSYKELRDKVKADVLHDFLANVDELPGLVLTVAVDRNLQSLSADVPGDHLAIEGLEDFRAVTPEVFEEMVRVANVVNMLLAGLSAKGQEVRFVTDRESFVVNSRRQSQFQEMLTRTASHHLRHRLGPFGIGFTDSDTGVTEFKDTAAVCDLIAGATCDLLRDYSNHDTDATSSDPFYFPLHVKNKSHAILRWAASSGNTLHRLAVVVTPGTEGEGLRFAICQYVTELSQPTHSR